MGKKHIVQSKETVIRDENGLERVVTSEKTLVHNVETDTFYGTFLNYVGWVYDIRGGVALQVLTYMMDIAEFNTGRVVFSTGERKRLMKRAKISRAGLYKALAQLEEVGAIAPVVDVDESTGEQERAKGEYMINPEMYWKGELSKRRKLIVTFRSINDDEAYDDGMNGFTSSSTFESE